MIIAFCYFAVPIRNTHRGLVQGKFGYLVKWKGYGEEENSWVREEDAG
jgi:hypothetical protein